MRGAVTRRSLEANAPERKSGRTAFRNARSLFENTNVTERGDEEYGAVVYTADSTIREENDDSSNSKSINDLIKVSTIII